MGPGTEGHRQRGACGPGRVRTGTVGGAVKGWDWQGGWPQKSWQGPGCGGPAGAPMLEGEGQPTSLHPDPPASLWA